MGSETARRRPDRRRVLVSLLRRVAIGAALASLALWLGPRVLVELGVLGPSAGQRVGSAERTLRAAESYGATPATRSYPEAKQALQEARGLLAQGRTREARKAADRAGTLAIDAQRSALLQAEQQRRRAEAVVKDIDARVNALEERFGQVTPGLPPPAVSTLLSRMKEARQAAGAVFLAWEEGEPARVLEGEASARAAVDAAADGLEQAAREKGL